MFGGGVSTEYEDIVNKTTDENLTSENWELILNLCDKVQDEGQTGAHAAIAAILKRLAHRNPNVQLYALSLTESLSKNLGIDIHRELASKAFTQGLEKLITDRNTHEKVRRRALGLVALWTAEFEKDETLGIMEDCYNNLKAKNYKFEHVEEAPPPAIDDDIRRKEEEELQRVLEMSIQDKGGRGQWAQYSLASDSSSSAPAASSSAASRPSESSSTHPFAAPKYSGGGYVPARTPSPARVAAQQRQQAAYYQQAQHKYDASTASSVAESTAPAIAAAVAPTPAATQAAPPTAAAAAPAPQQQPAAATSMNIVTRVRALHTFEPTEPGELAFEKGDIIKVVDRGYKDWWRGQLKGRTGIFPVNYVEAMPEPTAAELARESEQEAAVFAQAVNVEKLLNMLHAMDPAKDNLADNEEIQELYRSSMALRPKIVKLIDKYSQKRADLVSMNETFVRARTIFDRMMEESLARHTGVYEQAPTFRVPQYGPPAQGRPDSRGAAGRRPEFAQPAQSGYGWNAPTSGPAGYPGYGAPANSYQATSPAPQQQPPQQYVDPSAAYGGPAVGTPQGAPQQVPAGYGVVPQGGYAGHQPQAPYSQQGPTPYPVQQQPVQSPMQQQPIQQQPAQQSVQQQPIQQPIQPQQQLMQQPVQQQPIQQQPIQQQPIQQQPVQQQPVQQQPVQQQPVQQQPVQQQPVQQQPIQQQPIQPQPVQQQPVQQQQPIQPQPIQQQPIQQQSIQSQPVQQQPVQQDPFQQQPAQTAQQPQQHHPAQVQPDVQATASPASATSPQAQTQHPQAAEAQPQSQSPTQAQPAQAISGPPPYVYNPSYTYADPNVQAWAQYYAQGGKDLAGAVYFVSIPGVTDAPPASPQQVPPQQRQQSLQSHAQPQTGSQPQQAQSELAYAADPARTASPTQQQPQQRPVSYQLHEQPVSQAQPQYAASGPSSPANNAGPAATGASPIQASNVPSWVIPKKTGPIGGPGDSYFPPTNQMAGVTLTDPGSGGAVSG